MGGGGSRSVALAVVASVAACAAPGAAGSVELACVGTEPFWRLELTVERERYRPLEGAEAAYAGWLAPAVNRLTTFVWRGGPAGEEDGGELVAVVDETYACSDGMSDVVYRYEVVVSLPDGTALAGCCRAAAEHAGAATGTAAAAARP